MAKKPKSRASWKKKDRIKRDDNVMVGGLPTDIVIPVMGPTGVGKSTFINILLGKDVMLVGHDISSCTSTVQYEIVDNPPPLKGHRVIIVDTPGFDNTYVDDVEILRRIAVWLASSYDNKMKLGGVIYLQSIADKRMKSMTRRNLDMLCHLYGDKFFVFGTTNWGEVDENVGKKREQQLVTFWNWNLKTDLGSKSLRFDQTKGSARGFLDVILSQLEYGENEDILSDNVLRNDPEMKENLPVMILLMGEVGAGKSTFINTAADKTLAQVGHDLYPCTSTVKHFVIQHHKCEVVLVDTPGFNHPTKVDGDVLRGIVDWLKNKCPKNLQFGGIIYLHDLSQPGEFTKLKGKQIMTATLLDPHRVVLAMVDGDSNIAKRRESKLKDTISRELRTCQFMNTKDSAWSILDTILGVDPIGLQYIQDELDRICTKLSRQPKQNRSVFSSLFGFNLGCRSRTTNTTLIRVSRPPNKRQ